MDNNVKVLFTNDKYHCYTGRTIPQAKRHFGPRLWWKSYIKQFTFYLGHWYFCITRRDA